MGMLNNMDFKSYGQAAEEQKGEQTLAPQTPEADAPEGEIKGETENPGK